LTPAPALVRQLDFVAREGWKRSRIEVGERRVWDSNPR
jgi:hypothetical protein